MKNYFMTLIKLMQLILLTIIIQKFTVAGTNEFCISYGEKLKDRGYNAWKETIACKESDWQYSKDYGGSAYKGKYQMGCPSLEAANCLTRKCKDNSALYDSSIWKASCGGSLAGFKANGALQEQIFKTYMNKTWQYVKGECGNVDALIGKTYSCPGTGNVTLTLSGLMTAAHLVGSAGSCTCMRANQTSGFAYNSRYKESFNCKDGNAVSWCTYAALGKNFDVSYITGKKDGFSGSSPTNSGGKSNTLSTIPTSLSGINCDANRSLCKAGLDCLDANTSSPKCQKEVLPSICKSKGNKACADACFQQEVQNDKKATFCKKYRQDYCKPEWAKFSKGKPYDKRCGKICTNCGGDKEETNDKTTNVNSTQGKRIKMMWLEKIKINDNVIIY